MDVSALEKKPDKMINTSKKIDKESMDGSFKFIGLG